MVRDRDGDESSSASQSKRPALNHQESDSTNSDNAVREQHHQHRSKPQKHVRKPTFAATHRRVQSDAKLSRDSSSTNLSKNTSSTSLRRNKSHGEVNKKSKSSDKLKRTNSNPAVNKVKPQKSQVHFDLGNDGQDDEWVDASTSASPYLSRRGSLASAQSSAKPDDSSANNSANNSAYNSRTETPAAQPSPPASSTPDRETVQHKEYLTSRLLQRTPSHGAPPKMTADTVSVSRRGQSQSPDSISRVSNLADSHNINTLPGTSSGDELISRFVGAGSSGAAREGSFYNLQRRPDSRRSEDIPQQRPQSSASSGRPSRRESGLSDDEDGTALAPRSARRSVIEPGQAVGGGVGAVGASPLVGIGGPGYDGGASRDPRVAKQLEKTGMEYLSVRRFQNPVARSLDRLAQANRQNKNQRIPRNGTASLNGKAASMRSGIVSGQHTRASSINESSAAAARRPMTPRAQSIRTNGAGSSFEADVEDHQSSRALHEGAGTQGLSGSSLVGGEEDEGVTAILRNLWEKNLDLSASQD
ncbi:hypothetical protein CGLO_04893 [Colletotrichum gloeosporioides Cg-14]|uniref:Uncharacterized protein n=1 Tax=Colletotrichum gloeosporioides (strain Cg-14) TaxID=1237896 RepID=T0KIK2_COLGC|nr:hypothetical protein CGLO_04893 [Colletotrichum gloeosporioides Cg-14]